MVTHIDARKQWILENNLESEVEIHYGEGGFMGKSFFVTTFIFNTEEALTAYILKWE